jgi:hypothetical protein
MDKSCAVWRTDVNLEDKEEIQGIFPGSPHLPESESRRGQ